MDDKEGDDQTEEKSEADVPELDLGEGVREGCRASAPGGEGSCGGAVRGPEPRLGPTEVALDESEVDVATEHGGGAPCSVALMARGAAHGAVS